MLLTKYLQPFEMCLVFLEKKFKANLGVIYIFFLSFLKVLDVIKK